MIKQLANQSLIVFCLREVGYKAIEINVFGGTSNDVSIYSYDQWDKKGSPTEMKFHFIGGFFICFKITCMVRLTIF